MKLKIGSLIVGSLLVFGCNQAQFSGSNKSQARPQGVALSCAASPEQVKLGETVAIAVTQEPNLKNSVYQRVLAGDEVGETVELKFDDAKNAFVRADGSPNELTPSIPNTSYEVELRETPDAAGAKFVCQFSVGDGTTPPAVTPPTTCEETVAVGAHVAFLIDNSTSNNATDCPGAVATGEVIDGAVLKKCSSATNRETAVLSSFDLLSSISASSNDPASSLSRIAVASFPKKETDITKDSDSFQIQGEGWFDSNSENQGKVSSALAFTRLPFGRTPYTAALNAATDLFKDMTDDGKARVAILVTDGEPTDQNPVAAAELSDNLRKNGVEVFTVFVNGGETRAAREARHIEMLKRFNEVNQKKGRGTWWIKVAGVIESIEQYFDYLLGRKGNPSLVERISSKVDTSCEDKNGAVCKRQVIEVANSEALKGAVTSIIRSRAVQCVRP